MVYAGIDVAKDNHDCLIVDSNGKVLSKVFTITNNKQGFDELFVNLRTHSQDLSELKVGLEATDHYSDNLLEFLIANNLSTTVINPLYTNLYRKGLSLRKTKTDLNRLHNILKSSSLGCSICHAIIKVQFFLKCSSAVHSKNFILWLDF